MTETKTGASEACGDNRFELVAKYRAKLLDGTNIEDRPEEMAVIDNVLFRCWQMGWLDRLEGSDNENERLCDELNFERSKNAKLRELVLEIWRSCPVSDDDCAKCPHHMEEDDEVWCDIPILMEKIGIEVD